MMPIGGKLATLGKYADGPWRRTRDTVFEVYENVASWVGLDLKTRQTKRPLFG
jgi:hypothetical protein